MEDFSDSNKSLKRIIEIHFKTKELTLKAEELDLEHELFFGPIIQQRDALDHIIRALYPAVLPDEFSSSFPSEDKGKYLTLQFDKALGHIYRAFFDVTDWLGIVYRENIGNIMEPYSVEDTRKWFPEYLSKIEPEISRISLKIAEVRESKDIGNGCAAIVDNYIELIKKLENYYVKVINGKIAIENGLLSDNAEPNK